MSQGTSFILGHLIVARTPGIACDIISSPLRLHGPIMWSGVKGPVASSSLGKITSKMLRSRSPQMSQ